VTSGLPDAGLSASLIELDPAEAARKHQERDRHLNVVGLPRLRLLGMLLLLLLVALHGLFILPPASWRGFELFAGVAIGYTALSWWLLARFYRPGAAFDLGFLFLNLDVFVFAAAIYVSGAEQSRLFLIILVRVADQVNTTFRRVRYFLHLCAAAYLLLILYVVYVDGRELSWTAETVKVLVVYATGLYIALTARTSEALRERTSAAVRMARELILQLRAQSRELIEAQRKAEESSRLKSEFLANMSHEIRTPMNGILGMTEVTLAGELRTDQRENLQAVQSSARALMHVVNDILDFSKIEAGRLELDELEFSLRGTVDVAVRTLEPLADEKKLLLRAEVAPELEDTLLGDPQRLGQILLNLIGNAIKFTPAGTVTLSVACHEAQPPELLLRFSVADTGIGVPEAQREVIFDAFRQADGSITRHYGGTGLGLSISTRLVTMMGGRIWMESEVGRGTIFHFTVRCRAVQREAAAPELDAALLRGQRALLLDPDPAHRTALEGTLRSRGLTTVGTVPGAPAIDLLSRYAAAAMPFRVVILDCRIGDIDGFALARRIFEQAELGRPAFVMLAAVRGRNDAARCRELGIVAQLLEPVREAELLAAIGSALRNGEAQPILELEADELLPRPLRVLLAEDNRINQRVATRLLERLGHEVLVTENGQQALELLAREQVDVVLMDVQMPELDGLEATRRLRELEQSRGSERLPVIAMTAHALPSDRERCLAAGMDGYVSKPIDSDSLLGALRELKLGGPA
jgi:signal transduction histidine kinase/DNA-binding response OmpR family regulator